MPNRIKYSFEALFSPEGRETVNVPKIEVNFEPANKTFIDMVQNINTSEEVVNVGDVSSAGLIVIENLDAINFVTVGLTGSYPIKLRPGRFCAFPPVGTIYALANTGTCDVRVRVFPDAS